jgi:F-type H+-transporting ATPase subunit c
MNTTRIILVIFAILMFAMPTYAADGTGFTLTSGFSMAIASGLCALGQGKAIAAAAEGIARNPGAAAAIRGVMLIGLILIESLALYTLVIIFAKV